MQHKLYKLPFSMVDLVSKKQLSSVDLVRSIAQNLRLIITTQYGSYSFDRDFGCAVWDLEYENVVINQVFKDTLTHTLLDCIKKYEPRLTNIEVMLDFKIEDLPPRTGRFERKRVKRKFDIQISGELILTREPFKFRNKVYLSPFSYN